MCKFYTSLLLLLFALTVFSQIPEKQSTEREKLIFKINREIEDDTVIEVLLKCNNDILLSIKESIPLSALRYSSLAFSIDNRFIKYRWFIADTGLSRKWLKKIHELLIYMSKTQSYLESAKFNGRTKTAKYKKAMEYFQLAYERLNKLIRKPVRMSIKVRQRIKVKKHMWQRRMWKKHKIKTKLNS